MPVTLRFLRLSVHLALLAAMVLLVSSCSSSRAPRDYPAGTRQPQQKANEGSPQKTPPAESSKHEHHERTPSQLPSPAAAKPTEDEQIEQSLQNLRQGKLAYETPAKMKMGDSQTVTARIGSEEVDSGALTQGLGQSGGTVSTVGTPISVKMKMTLKSADFDITPLSSEEQVVGGTKPAEWEWTVSPKHSGTLRLHLDAAVELKDVSRDFTTVDREIAVSVDPVGAIEGFVQNNWQWILSTLAAGIGLAWKFFGAKKKESAGAA
jgi:hypothetical protein